MKKTPEQWLNELTEALRPKFKTVGLNIPAKTRISCGFTSRKGRAGECWQPTASKDKHAEIFIVPQYDDAIEVASILVHELIHAAGIRGHGKTFKQPATALGLTGPMKATVATDELKKELRALCKPLGKYPHAELNSAMTTGDKKQTTRMIKIECPTCGYTVRAAKKWITVGVPTCPCGVAMIAETPEEPEEEEGE